jgi:hypothetical protein
VQDAFSGTGLLSRRIEIFHAHQPDATGFACVKVARQCGDQ